MSARLIMSLLGAVVIGGPLLYINLVALGRQAAFEQAIDGETVVPSSIASIGQRADSLFGDIREGRKISSLFHPTELNRNRAVTFVSDIAITDVLAEGEAPPAPEFHKMFIEARAPLYEMERNCPLILETFATGCVSAKVDVDQRRDGSFRLTSALAYRPDHDLGTFPEEGATDLYRVTVGLSRDRLMTEIPQDKVQEIKALMYSDAMTACNSLREERGNCVIEKIEFSAFDVEDKPDTARIAAVAYLAWVGPRAAGGDNSILGNVSAANPEEAAERAGLFARVSGALSGDDNASGSGDAPSVLRGGNAFRGAGEANFLTAPGE